MNSTANGSSGSWPNCFAQLNFTASKIRGTVTFCLIIIVSLAANSLIVMVVYKTPNLKKPINYFIANMDISDLLFPIFLIPLNLSNLHNNYSWLIGGQLGQALYKLVRFFGGVSTAVSSQSLILIAVDRFGAVVFPLRSPTHQIQAVFLLHSHHVDSCRIRRVIVPCQFPTSLLHSVDIHPCDVFSHSLLHHSYQAQDTGTPR